MNQKTDSTSSSGSNASTWFDLTHSMTWGGGIVGIVRAELELAAGLKKLNPALRFSMFSAGRFVELPDDSLNWLFTADNVAEAYLEHKGRKPAPATKSALPVTSLTHNRIQAAVDRASQESSSALDRLQYGAEMVINAQSKWLRRALRLLTIPGYPVLRGLSALGIRYRRWRNRKAANAPLPAPPAGPFAHPYKAGDLIISVGWVGSGKEEGFLRVKRQIPSIKLSYLIYDTIVAHPRTKHLYPDMEGVFLSYINWISQHCDLVFFGGENAKADTLKLQREYGWRSPPGVALKFGTDIVKLPGTDDADEVLRNLGITGPFIIAVGTIEPRKNYTTLYQAYVRALEMAGDRLPQLIICGRQGVRSENLLQTLRRDPRIAGKLLVLSPSDHQLEVMYRKCLFTVLPSLYEGWSLTLPESLSYGKFCLVTDTPPLREIGRDMIDYVGAWDVLEWARKLVHYSTDAAALRDREQAIAKDWDRTTWLDTAKAMTDALQGLEGSSDEPEVWLDISTTYLHWAGGVTGIVRAELTFAMLIAKKLPKARFFAADNGRLFEVGRDRLLWLLEGGDLSEKLRHFQNYWSHHEREGTASRRPFGNTMPRADMAEVPRSTNRAIDMAKGAALVVSALPRRLQSPAISLLNRFYDSRFQEAAPTDGSATKNDYAPPRLPSEVKAGNAGFFAEGSIVLFTGLDLMAPVAAGEVTENIFTSYLIYDLTPMLTPQLHLEATQTHFTTLFGYVSKNFDQIVYGGVTAQRDGALVQQAQNWPVVPSASIEFGTDIKPTTLKKPSAASDKSILQRLGIGPSFILAIGTIEPRKNYETLYRAYLTMIENGETDLPQLVIVGRPGWLTSDFVEILDQDTRTKNLIMRLSPTDEELDVIYRQCRFTVLASLYEGWSLTLPESLGHGKFALVSDVEPLRETGRDLVDYIDPWDSKGWAEKILYYTRNPNKVAKCEERIRGEWKNTSWDQSTDALLDAVQAGYIAKFPGRSWPQALRTSPVTPPKRAPRIAQ